MNTSYLLLGSNLGDRKNYLEQAIIQIDKRVGSIKVTSSIFVTKAWGNTNQQDFYNQAIVVETVLSANELLEMLLGIEELLGRKRNEKKWQARTIDIDILFFNDDIIDTPHLTIPHPFIQDRKFVLVPLCEIASEMTHPLLQKTIKILNLECKDELLVTKLT